MSFAVGSNLVKNYIDFFTGGEEMRPLKQLIQENPVAAYHDMFIELSSNQCAVVNNCSGVLEYNTKAVTLAGHRKSVTFIGDHLELKNLAPTSAVIVGKILAIEFDDRGLKDDH